MRSLFGFIFALLLLPPAPALAADTAGTAYFVASGPVFESLAGIRAYIKDAGVPIVHVAPEELNKLKGVKRYMVFGSPDQQDAVGGLIRSNLTDKELKAAETMGKGVLEIKKIDDQEALVFATQYSMNSFVKGSKEEWKYFLEDWYGITLSVTSIVGY